MKLLRILVNQHLDDILIQTTTINKKKTAPTVIRKLMIALCYPFHDRMRIYRNLYPNQCSQKDHLERSFTLLNPMIFHSNNNNQMRV